MKFKAGDKVIRINPHPNGAVTVGREYIVQMVLLSTAHEYGHVRRDFDIVLENVYARLNPANFILKPVVNRRKVNARLP